MASRTEPPAPADTEMMTMSLSDKPPGASVEGRGVLPGSASVGDWVGGIVLLSLVDCEASGVSVVGCRISEVTPLPLPTFIVPKPSSICEVVVGVSMVGGVDVWGGSEGEGRGVVGMVGGVDIWGGAWGEGRGEAGMVGGVDVWGGAWGAIVLAGNPLLNKLCALESGGRMLNATAASSRADNTWLQQYCAIVL